MFILLDHRWLDDLESVFHLLLKPFSKEGKEVFFDFF